MKRQQPTTLAAQKLLGDLISFPCLGGQSNIPIAKFIENYLTAPGVHYHNVPNKEGNKRSIHCRIGPAVEGGVILSGHMDVVSVAGQDWHTNPFKMAKKGDKLYGRGTCDMKGFIACCLACLPQMLATNLKKPIYFAFSYDEEIGCLAGPALAKSIRETYTEKPRFAIIGEPTSMKTVTAEKGMGTYETTVNSQAAHSSQIRTKVSAIHEAAKLTLWLENKMEKLIAAGQIDPRFDPPHSTMQVGLLNGGTAHNIVADKCILQWDLRTLPSDDIAKIIADFNDYCQERMQIAQKIESEFSITTEEQFPPIPPLDTPKNAAIVQFVNQLNGESELNAVSFASEAGQFATAGFAAILCGPGSVEQAHQANEFIEIRQLQLGVQFIQQLIEKNSS